MIIEYMSGLGSWNWIILGGILLALEVLAPGTYLLWIGIAALLTGTISFQLSSLPLWGWEIQTVVFVVLAVLTVAVVRLFFRGSEKDTDEPLLNRRDQQLIGRTATLEEPLRNGTGRIRLGDTLWRVEGPDLDIGAKVRVTSADNGRLHVEPL